MINRFAQGVLGDGTWSLSPSVQESVRCQDDTVPDDVNCRNCGVQLRRRWGRWQHVVRLGPVACPAAVPETAGHGGEVDPRRGVSLSIDPFPRAASRTRRACYPGTGLSTSLGGVLRDGFIR